MSESYAKIRPDLEIRAESGLPSAPVIVKDPITRRFYRFTFVQAEVLKRLDGLAAPAEIARVVSEFTGVAVETAQVEIFIRKLRSLLLLDDDYCWSKLGRVSGTRGTVLGHVLSVKLYSFNPDPMIAWLESRLRFCFHPASHLCASGLVAAAAIISAANGDSLFWSMGSLLTLSSIPLLVVVAFAVMTVHELGHAVTLKHFGGKVEEIGFMLLYFVPAFYCNTSDAWLLRRRHRIAVTLAGGYVQLVVWAAATLAWRLLAPEVFLSRLCLVVIAFSGVQMLFNFNPLIKLDGYYLLSDYLEVPNLRSKAFAHLRRMLIPFGAGHPGSASTGREREKSICVVYGAAAFVFTAAFLGIMLHRFGAWLVGEFQAWGIVLLCSVLVAMVVPVPARRAAEVQAAPQPAAAGQPRRRLWPYAAGAAVLLAAGFVPWELKIAGDFTIVAHRRASISPEVAGTIKTVLVDEGQQVRTGQVLAELQNLELSNAYEEVRGELASARAILNLLRAGNRPEEIERAERLVATKRTELENAARIQQEQTMLREIVARREVEARNAAANLDRSRKLFSAGLIARTDLDRDETLSSVREKELAEARSQLMVLDERTEKIRDVKEKELEHASSELQVLRAGSRMEQIEATRAQVSKLEEKLEIFGEQLGQLRIRTPMDGIVAKPYLRNRIGEYLEKGSTLCEVVSAGAVIVDMPVPEKEIADVKPGFPITLKVRGYPGLSFEARVKAMSPVATQIGSERKIVVQGELANPDGNLKAGMTGVGKILCGKRTILNLVTRRAIRWLRTEFWEYLP